MPLTRNQYLFCSPETRAKADEQTVLYSKNRIDALVTMIITLMILFLLIIPIYVLWHLAGQLENGKASASSRTVAATIGVLLVFTLIFSAVLSLFTRARRHEILGAAAAYCAVLVVFISNVGQTGGA
jgi:drug/metabolite transporter superfamily protein YnfA